MCLAHAPAAIAGALVLITALRTSAAATPCFDYGTASPWIGEVVPGSETPEPRVATDGSFLYVLVGSSDTDLLVYDLSGGGTPSLVGQTTIVGAPDRIAVDGPFAYVVTAQPGFNHGTLGIVDVFDPATPTLIGSVDASERDGFELAVSGSLVFFCTQTTCDIFDVSTPTAPVLASTVVGGARGVAPVGPRLYAVTNGSNLRVYDIRNPVSPALITSMSFEAHDVHFTSAGNLVAIGTSGLYTLDLTHPNNPAVIGHDPDITGDRIREGDGILYANNPLRALDLLDPTNPTAGDAVGTGTRAGSLPEGPDFAVADGLAYFGERHLPYLDVSPLTSVPVAGATQATGTNGHELIDMAVALDRARTLLASNGYFFDVYLGSFDLTNPESPAYVVDPAQVYVELGPLPTDGRMEVDPQGTGSPVYVALSALSSDVLRAIDVDANGLATPLGWIPVPALGEFAVRGTTVYAASTFLLSVLDFSDPAAPVVQDQMGGPGCEFIALSGDLALLADASGTVYAVDVSGPGPPSYRGFVSSSVPPVDLVASGSFAWIIDAMGGVHALDFSDPDVPFSAGTAQPSFAGTIVGREACVVGATLYVATDFGVLAYDVSAPGGPAYQGGAFSVGDAQRIGTTGSDLFTMTVSRPTTGLPPVWGHVFPLHCPTATDVGVLSSSARPSALRVWPNPSPGPVRASFALPGGTRTRVSVFDVTGRRVRTLSGTAGPDGAGHVTWDGLTEEGRRAADGVYFLSVGQGDARAAETVVLRRSGG